jgi:hypothetical protein
MKGRLWYAILTPLLLSWMCVAQAPKPALSSPSNEVSIDFLVPVKGPDVSYGFGGQIAGSHFLDEHIGIKLQSDYVRTDYLNLRDAGVRIGPIMRFATKHAVQPYLEALMGYARVESSYLKPLTSFHGSGSFMGGGGLDFPLSGGWYGRVGADLQDDWSARTRAGRCIVGISYRLGAR